MVEIAKLKVAARKGDDKRNLRQIKTELQSILENMKILMNWIEGIVPKPSLDEQPSLLSRGESPSPRSYVTTLNHDNTAEKDKEYVANGVGIPLPPRLEQERLDPKHRAWGNLRHPIIGPKLGKINDDWAAGDKMEDLTVMLEFNDNFRSIDRSFDPNTFIFPADEKSLLVYNAFNKYFTPREALQYLLSTDNNNRLINSDKEIVNAVRDINFVMDMSGNLFVSKDGDYVGGKRIGHPSFTAGEPVACAGTIKIENGKITKIYNNSGHYQPTAFSLHRVVNELSKRNVLAGNFKVQDCSQESDFIFKNGDQNVFEMSLEQFNSVFEQKMAGAQKAEVDLSEKPNPIAVIKIIEKLNQYLSQRAQKTNSIASLFTGAYSGKDYYLRRNAFVFIIKKMLEENFEVNSLSGILQEKIKQFHRGFSHEFSDLLQELKDTINSYPDAVKSHLLSHPCLKEKLDETRSVYDAMYDLSLSINYEQTKRLGFFNKRDIEKVKDTKAEKTKYKFALEKTKSDDGFLSAKEQFKLEVHNLKCF